MDKLITGNNNANLQALLAQFGSAIPSNYGLLNWGTLRVMKDLNGANNSYEYSIKDTSPNTDQALEKEELLTDNELFIVFAEKLIVKQNRTDAAAEYGANFQDFTYPDANEFGAAVAADLGVLYHGRTAVQKGSGELVGSHRNTVYLQAPDVQKEVAATPQPQANYPSPMGYIRYPKPYVLNPKQDMKIILSVGVGRKTNLAVAGTTKLQAGYEFYGAKLSTSAAGGLSAGTC